MNRNTFSTRFSFAVLLAAFLSAVSTPTSAIASILGDVLTFNAREDRLVDDSVGRIISADDTVSAGDIIQGIFQLNKAVLDAGDDIEVDLTTPNRSVYAVYSFEVQSTAIDGNTAFVNLKAVTAGSHTISNILAAAGFSVAGDTLGLTDNAANSLDLTDSSIVIFEKNGSTSLSSFTAASGFVSGGAIAGVINDTSWDASVVLGMTGDDFHQIKLDGLTIDPIGAPPPMTFTGADLLSLTNLAILNSLANGTPSFNITLGSFASAYSIVEHSFSSDTVFLPVVALDADDGSFHVGDVASAGSTSITNATGGEVTRGWLFGDKGDFAINAVPEPASMLAWVGIAGLAGLVGVYRRKTAK